MFKKHYQTVNTYGRWIKIPCCDEIRNLSCFVRGVRAYSHSVGLFELADLLDLIHEISSVYVLHDKIQAVLRGDRGDGGAGEGSEIAHRKQDKCVDSEAKTLNSAGERRGV